MRILGIRRAERFSPGSAERDEAIFAAVARVLTAGGHQVTLTDEDRWCREAERPTAKGSDAEANAAAVFHMARDPQTLARLARLEARGVTVVNSAAALLHTSRAVLAQRFEGGGVSVVPQRAVGPADAPPSFADGRRYWLKRGDACAQHPDDVCPIDSADAYARAMAAYARRGVGSILLSDHVPGDLVKFYGVEGTSFFYAYAATAPGGFSKYGMERLNGTPQGYAYDVQGLKADADRAARLSGYTVYGGDCIIDAAGRWHIIDFNDWPSFAPCVAPAAEAIASRLTAAARW